MRNEQAFFSLSKFLILLNTNWSCGIYFQSTLQRKFNEYSNIFWSVSRPFSSSNTNLILVDGFCTPLCLSDPHWPLEGLEISQFKSYQSFQINVNSIETCAISMLCHKLYFFLILQFSTFTNFFCKNSLQRRFKFHILIFH